MTTIISYVSNNKDRPLLVGDNYIYYVSKTTTRVKYWKCKDRSRNADVHTSIRDVFIKVVGNHSHL